VAAASLKLVAVAGSGAETAGDVSLQGGGAAHVRLAFR
jgi:hypothetical protein